MLVILDYKQMILGIVPHRVPMVVLHLYKIFYIIYSLNIYDKEYNSEREGRKMQRKHLTTCPVFMQHATHMIRREVRITPKKTSL